MKKIGKSNGENMRNPPKQQPIKIESEIPIPNGISWAAAARAMEVGDSVEVENRKQANALGVALYQSGFRAISRVTVFPKVRVWKAVREKRPWLRDRDETRIGPSLKGKRARRLADAARHRATPLSAKA